MAQKFICDGMLGKLSRLLRMIGIDTAYSNEGMAILLSARREERIILTRNRQLRGRKDVFFVEATTPEQQLHVLVERYGLWSDVKPFTRCVLCNERLVAVEKAAVKDKVPYFTYEHHDEYARCPGCGRIYWKGSHYKNMLREVEAVLGRGSYEKNT
ncbi:Mut7-C RNAse domain-containing protein [candidate division WOR-3 bacterium]|nr:Mut7-C RNAse domain-containing protein [candidate division WOR-3 bacterium]